MAIIKGEEVFEFIQCPICHGEAIIREDLGSDKWALCCCNHRCGFYSNDIYIKRIYQWGFKKYLKRWEKEYSKFAQKNIKFTIP